jgi:hypothetical protein
MFGIGSVIPQDGKRYELRIEFNDSYLAFNVADVRDRISIPKQRMLLRVI